MTRLWASGVAIRVQTHGEEPALFYWNGQAHPVGRMVNHWRVDVGWWRLRIWRDYYRLVTTTGLLVVVYHDGVNGEWRLQRVYD
jgi:hypothetical protein